MNSKMILVADDDSAMCMAISMRLGQLGFSTMRSPDATHALFGAHKIHPDLIILDLNMPGGNGMTVCEMLASHSEYAKIPVVIHTGCSDEPTKRRARDLGAKYVLKSPDSWQQLQETVCDLLEVAVEQAVAKEDQEVVQENPDWPQHRSDLLLPVGYNRIQPATSQGVSLKSVNSPKADQIDEIPRASALVVDEPSATATSEKQPKVLCIDDDPDVSKTIMIRLRPYGVEVHRAFNGMQGFWTALDILPDVIILDMQMPDDEGNYVYRRFTDHSLLCDIPVIVLSGVDNVAVERTMFSLGVDAYLHKPLVFDQLLQQLRLHLALPKEPQSLTCAELT
ncbi:MAG: response regulator [Pirellulales bacterium]